jgi:serine/threonine-protein kinase
MPRPPLPRFDRTEDELDFLRALDRLHRLVDDLLEECLQKRLGLAAALEVIVGHCMRMVGAEAGFVELFGTKGPVLSRVKGALPVPLEDARRMRGRVPLASGEELFVWPLDLGTLHLGALGLSLPKGEQVRADVALAFVASIAEQLDNAVLAFVALTDGEGPLQRLDRLSSHAAMGLQGWLGKYELLAPLAAGGMGQVLVARTTGPQGLGRLVAVKRMLPDLAEDEQAVHQFLDEARVCLKLAHGNLVAVHDFGEASGVYYLAMELVRGVDLRRVLKKVPGLSPPLAVGIAVQALAGLQAAHDLQQDGKPLELVHRDLSPHNLMLTFEGEVKVLDFGLAKTRAQRAVTMPGFVKGKWSYMSPEQARGERLDRRSDVYAMALVLYELLVGAPAVPIGKNDVPHEVVLGAKIRRDHRIPEPIWDVLERALHKKPEQRLRSADELSTQLREAVTPATEAELARLIRPLFPERLRQLQAWDSAARAPRPA